jgi:hypothetical protein
MIINGPINELAGGDNIVNHQQIYNAYKLKNLQKKGNNKKIL